MEHIKIIIENYLKRKKIGKYLSKEKEIEQELQENWEKIVGEKFSKFSEPYKIINNILFIYVKNSVIISELSYMKKTLIKKINKLLPLSISNIIFKIKQ